ncbi:NAD(P)H-binding protein [Herbiconiux sp. CPCC 205716]|uniref:NAD(P)H-binding protein n=1 Tax=Herbiconiux gentiana TaxID=2970912 RepID=A0ABT2GKR6_9MICO|nr:NAD(P)H-binding protein [Herbiconiux gentiana]MCS5715351.1 NAD(P)H-binding protein [Herbiconiux gentiana]
MILVTGSSGHLGSAILSALSHRGVLATGSSRGGEGSTRRLDFDDPETISLVDVDTLVLVSAGEAEDDVVIARHDAVLTAAERDGVEHVVYTSLTSAGDHLGFALAHRWTERRLRRSALSWTILRNGLYAELFGSLLDWSGPRLTSAFGGGGLAAVSRGDLAEAAAIVAEAPRAHRGRTYDLVGPPITAKQVAELLNVPLDEVTLDERRSTLERAGLKPFQPAMLMSIYSGVRHGFLDTTGPDLTRVLGREPSDTLAIAAAAARALGDAVPPPSTTDIREPLAT